MFLIWEVLKLSERECENDRAGRDFSNSSSDSWSTERRDQSQSRLGGRGSPRAQASFPWGGINDTYWGRAHLLMWHQTLITSNLLIPGARPQRGCQLRVPGPRRQPGGCWEAFWSCWPRCGRNTSRWVLTFSLIFIPSLGCHSAVEHWTIMDRSQILIQVPKGKKICLSRGPQFKSRHPHSGSQLLQGILFQGISHSSALHGH